MLYEGRIIWQGPVGQHRRQRQRLCRPVHPRPRRGPDPDRRRHAIARPDGASRSAPSSARAAVPPTRAGPAAATIAAPGTASSRRRRRARPPAAGGKARGRRARAGAARRARPTRRRALASGIDELDRVLGGGLVAGCGHADRRRPRHRQVHADAAGGRGARGARAARWSMSAARNRSTRSGCARAAPRAGRQRRSSSPAPPRWATSWPRSTGRRRQTC